MSSPHKFSHVVLQTNRVTELRDFYVTLLDARVQFEVGPLCLLTYDDEHHRVALVNLQPYAEHSDDAAGMHHMAYTYDSLGALLANYRRLKERDVLPALCLNHGPTVSLYYRDPDGNQVELQVDVFDSAEEANAFMRSPIYQNDPIGLPFDPDEMHGRLLDGVPAATLMARVR